jgi:hypothetical protein
MEKCALQKICNQTRCTLGLLRQIQGTSDSVCREVHGRQFSHFRPALGQQIGKHQSEKTIGCAQNTVKPSGICRYALPT